ncbi:NAD(P)H-binding protein [Kribbella sp. NBC_01245]|uniref:NAD(P)H-binding protein n=1 Tax=Kribbella sp. NBC_01245 TaxID=2903578 RepID=UPI002E29E84E|nr:NAD(P)H-binding protein [Kribbella sp. NBC_01245]
MTTLVLAATGKTGRRVTSLLGPIARGVSRRSAIPFDWNDPNTWAAAVEGADAAYVVPPIESLDYSAVPEFVDLAKRSGVRNFVLLSARGMDLTMPHEAAVSGSGVDWTILRPAWFAQNFSEDMMLPAVLAGEVALPTGDGRHAFIDVDDIAEVAVAALTGAGSHAGQVYELTGPEAITFGEAVALIAAASGREIKYVDVPPESFRAELVGHGMNPEYADLLTTLLTAIRNGQDAEVADGVQRALGRTPRTFTTYAQTTATTPAWS